MGGTGGTLLIVGHLHTEPPDPPAEPDPEHWPPAEASVTLAGITAGLDPRTWAVVTAEEHARTMTASDGRALPLRDVIVRATRRS